MKRAGFDTSTATSVGVWEIFPDDWIRHEKEALYRGKGGRYALHGQGGPYTKYSRRVGEHDLGGGERMRILTPEAAKAWAKEHLSAEAFAAEFGIDTGGKK